MSVENLSFSWVKVWFHWNSLSRNYLKVLSSSPAFWKSRIGVGQIFSNYRMCRKICWNATGCSECPRHTMKIYFWRDFTLNTVWNFREWTSKKFHDKNNFWKGLQSLKVLNIKNRWRLHIKRFHKLNRYLNNTLKEHTINKKADFEGYAL